MEGREEILGSVSRLGGNYYCAAATQGLLSGRQAMCLFPHCGHRHHGHEIFGWVKTNQKNIFKLYRQSKAGHEHTSPHQNKSRCED